MLLLFCKEKTESVTEMTFSGTNLLFYNMVYYKITSLESLRHAPKKIVKTQHLISANNFTIFKLIFVVNSKLRRMQNLSQILEPQVFKLFFPSFSKEMSCLSCMIHCLLSCIMSFLKETFFTTFAPSETNCKWTHQNNTKFSKLGWGFF